MDLQERIKSNYNSGFFGRGMLLEETGPIYPAWTIKMESWYGIIIPVNSDVEFNERFAKAKLYTEKSVLIDNVRYNCLILSCDDMSLRNEFSAISAQFADPGENGENRKALAENPEKWWQQWKYLLGNAERDISPYPVLGELSVMLKLKQSGRDPLWSGIHKGTHDVELSAHSYEVKSTIARTGYQVTINGPYQLKSSGEPLDLVFCRFEPSLSGKNLNEIVNELVSHGCNESDLETALSNHGLPRGCTARNSRYRLLEMKVFPVDEGFPRITENSFKEGIIPPSIINIKYTVDLAGLPCRNNL